MKQRKMFGLVLSIAVIAALIMPQAASAVSEDDVRAMMTSMNDQLAANGENVRLWIVDFITIDESGRRVLFDNRQLQLGSHWVPGDPNRWFPPRWDITWLSDQVDGEATGVSLEDTQAAVDRAMATWDNETCATIPLTKLPDYGMDWGYVQYWYWWINVPGENGGFPGWFADLTHAGWLPGEFFEWVLGPGTSDFVLGVTFGFIWVDEFGNPTDIDNNGKRDIAFREINYNNKFTWAIDANIDVESVVVHEAGHGVSLGHFGLLFEDPNGVRHWAPKAVMNAGYTGPQQELLGADIAAFCSVWSSWPNN